MTAEWGVRSVSVPAEWAWYGKQPGDYEGYRVLACSEGPVSHGSFEEAIGTFDLGSPDELPQVGVSYLAPAGQPDRYLALAICDDAGAQRDANGRVIAYTRYFCASYRALFQAKIGYLALYQAFQGIELPWANGAGLLAQVPVLPLPIYSGGSRAAHVAAMLLTGRSVCVTGAGQAPVLDRLRFVDAVMALLPYGMRAKMSAATWTRSTRQHRFRLFFSDSPRPAIDGREPDLAVTWDGPEQAQVPAQYGFVQPYLDWLARDMRAPVDQLADYDEETGFGSTSVLTMLDKLQIEVPGRARPGPPPPQHRPQQPGPPALPRAPAGPLPKDHVTPILTTISDKVTTGNVRGLKADVVAVANTVKIFEEKYTGPSLKGHRQHFRDVIVQHQLLRPDLLEQLGGDARSFCRSLLKLAFGLPLTYAGYCLLEDMLAGSQKSMPPADVLQVIFHAGMPDPRLAVIVLSFYEEKEQRKWFSSGQVQVGALVDALTEPWDQARHARMVCEALLWHLDSAQGKAATPEVREALRFHGFLAPGLAALYPGDLEFQVDALRTFLLAAHGGSGFGRAAVVETLRDGPHAPTHALLGAVLTLVDPNDQAMVDLARESYFRGSILRAGFGPDLETKLMRAVFPEGPQDLGSVSDLNATKPLDWSLQPPRPVRGALPAAEGPAQSPADPAAQQSDASVGEVPPAAFGDDPPGGGRACGPPESEPIAARVFPSLIRRYDRGPK